MGIPALIQDSAVTTEPFGPELIEPQALCREPSEITVEIVRVGRDSAGNIVLVAKSIELERA